MPSKNALIRLILLCLVLALIAAPLAAQADPGAVLAAARLDIESLANQILGSGARPAGWVGNTDVQSASFVLDLRLDLENLAGALFAPDQRPPGWFGAVRSTPWAIARDVRHDLELLAETQLGPGSRPDIWIGGAPLMVCDRALQALVAWLIQNAPAFTPGSYTPGPGYCGLVSEETNTFAEITLPGAAPAGDVRADLDLLMRALFGLDGERAIEGWVGGADTASIRQDLELLLVASAALGEPLEPGVWFGAAVGEAWIVTRADRHDLEVLANARLGLSRPGGWSGTEALVACSRSTQNLIRALGSVGFVYSPPTVSAAFCQDAEREASIFVEARQPEAALDFGAGGGAEAQAETAAPTGATTPVTTPPVVTSGPLLAAEIAAEALLNYGDTITATIDAASFQHIFAFNGRSGDNIFVTMTPAEGETLDAVLVLVDVSGNFIAVNADAAESLGAQLRAMLPGTGTYYLLATRFDGQTGTTQGEFTLELVGGAGQPLVAAAQAEGSILLLNSGDAVQNTLNDTAWQRVYAFEALAGDAVALALEAVPGTDLDPYLVLLDGAENVLAANDDAAQSDRDARLAVTLPQNGVYYLVATRFMLSAALDPEVADNSGTFTVSISGNRPLPTADAQTAQAAPGSTTGQGGGAGPTTYTYAGGIPGEATTPLAFTDPSADNEVGLMPRGTFFTAMARSSREGATMMLVQGEGFVVWVSWPYTSITESEYYSLPFAEDVRDQLPQLLCYAAFCTQLVLTGDPVSGQVNAPAFGPYAGVSPQAAAAGSSALPAGLPADQLRFVPNNHVNILFNQDNVEAGWAEFRLQLCASPNSWLDCEPVLRLYEYGQLITPLRVENGYPLWRMTYYIHDMARLESAHYYTNQLWVSHPYDNRRP